MRYPPSHATSCSTNLQIGLVQFTNMKIRGCKSPQNSLSLIQEIFSGFSSLLGEFSPIAAFVSLCFTRQSLFCHKASEVLERFINNGRSLSFFAFGLGCLLLQDFPPSEKVETPEGFRVPTGPAHRSKKCRSQNAEAPLGTVTPAGFQAPRSRCSSPVPSP